MTIAKLFARIGLKADTGQAKQLNDVLGNIKVGMVAGIAAAAKLTAEFKALTQEALNGAAALQQFKSETGASAEELQKWQSIALQTNNSAESVTASIKAIAANQAKIKLGQGDISGYQLLGIDPNQDPFDVLEQLRVQTQGLSAAMKKNILSQMGVSSELIQVLELSNAEFEEMASRAFIIPQSAINSMSEARASAELTRSAFSYLKSMITAELAPGMIKLNKAIVKWVQENKEGVIKTVKTIVHWISQFGTAVFNAGRMIYNLVDNTIGWENAIKGLIAVFAILNAQLLLSPIGLITAGIILLVAILDDLYVYSQGKGGSLFGLLMEKFPELEGTILGIVDRFQEFIELMQAFFQGDEDKMGEILEGWGKFGELVAGVALYLGIVADYWESVGKFIFGGQEGRQEVIAGTRENVESAFQEFKSGDVLQGLLEIVGRGDLTNGSVEMNIYSNGPSPEVAEEVMRRLEQQYGYTQGQIRNQE